MTSTPAPAPAARPRRPARSVFGSAVLIFEAFVVFFATLVVVGLRTPGTSTGPIFAVGIAGAVLCIVAAGLQGRRGGVVVGSVVQVPLVLAGIVVPMMWFVGGLFAVLWVVAMRLGARIDAERAERAAASGPSGTPGPTA